MIRRESVRGKCYRVSKDGYLKGCTISNLINCSVNKVDDEWLVDRFMELVVNNGFLIRPSLII